MKYILVVIMAFLVQGCGADSAEKYDLKSPCVSAGSAGDNAPCQKRRPANQNVG